MSFNAVLTRYRAMAYIVGTLLIILVLVGVPLKYLSADGSNSQDIGTWITEVLGTAHGFLYMIFLVCAAMLAYKMRFPLSFTVVVLLLGTVPIASFAAERLATKRARAIHEAHLRDPSAPGI